MYKRMAKTAVAFSMALVLLVLRILQINLEPQYQASSASNAKVVSVDTKRGTVYDCNLNPLTNLQSESYLAVNPTKEALEKLKPLMDQSDLKSIYEKLCKGFPAVVKSNAAVQEDGDVRKLYVFRHFSDHTLAAHTIGYLNSENQGASGIEKAYNDWLSFDNRIGVRFSVDARGKALTGQKAELVNENYFSPQGVCLTLDERVQKIAEAALKDTIAQGAAAILDVKTGKIRGIVSKPDLNPNALGKSMDQTDSPFLNRAVTQYTVGSIFKIAVAAAAIEDGNAASTLYRCTGKIRMGATTFNCHEEKGHGSIGLDTALAQSCNTYFINLAQKVGGARILDMAIRLGLGKGQTLAPGMKTDSGVLPSAASLLEPGALANFSFGQGKLMATPVQIAAMVACVANGGAYEEPTLVECLVNGNGKQVQQMQRKPPVYAMEESTAKQLQKYLVATVESGTGKSGKPEKYRAGGKTATAQTGWIEKNGNEVYHTWFSGFYPAENPQYAIAIMKENGGSGSQDCAPIFKTICDELAKAGLVTGE